MLVLVVKRLVSTDTIENSPVGFHYLYLYKLVWKRVWVKSKPIYLLFSTEFSLNIFCSFNPSNNANFWKKLLYCLFLLMDGLGIFRQKSVSLWFCQCKANLKNEPVWIFTTPPNTHCVFCLGCLCNPVVKQDFRFWSVQP